MERWQLAANIAIVISSVIALVTVILTIVKMLKQSVPAPFRRKLEYINYYSDIIANYGTGIMIITDIAFIYDNEKLDDDWLVKIYERELKKKRSIYSNVSLLYSTYLKNNEIINRALGKDNELNLYAIDPTVQDPIVSAILLDDLNEIREKLKIRITYKKTYGFEETVTL